MTDTLWIILANVLTFLIGVIVMALVYEFMKRRSDKRMEEIVNKEIDDEGGQ